MSHSTGKTLLRGVKGVDYWYLSEDDLGPDYDDEHPFWLSPFSCNCESVRGKPFRTPLHGIMHRDNPFIVEGYRKMPAYSVMDCILSIFAIHNETLNIWTHLIPLLGMLWTCFWYVPRNISGNYFHVFMVGYAVPIASIIVFAGSCLFHIMKCNSIDDYHFFLTIDLSGIIFAVIGGIWMNTYLEFTCYPTLRYWNLLAGTLFGMLLVWPITPWLVKHRRTNIRTALYLIFGFWTFIWYWIKVLILENGKFDEWKWISLYYQVRFYLFLMAALVVRTLKLPERISLGRFNIYGASHQIFHCMVAYCMFMMYFDFHHFYFKGHFDYCLTW